ncbi:alpha/beta hydrolase family protein [Catenulispora yoronensis]
MTYPRPSSARRTESADQPGFADSITTHPEHRGARPGRRTALAGLAALGLGTLVPTLAAGPAGAAVGTGAGTATDTGSATGTGAFTRAFIRTGTPARTPAVGSSAAADTLVPLYLPPPTGPYRVGNVALHLIDRSRRDPWVATHPLRELMIGIWYPARDVEGHATVPWLPDAAWTAFLANNAVPSGKIAVPTTHGHDSAPADPRHGPHPVLLFSPGSGDDRDACTTYAEELVSHGYVVVTIDHTHDSSEVEFPDGHVEPRTIPPGDTLPINTEAVAVRTADARFVLDQLHAISNGRNPDVDHRRLPRGLGEVLDLSRVGMYGHSMGGATGLDAAHRPPVPRRRQPRRHVLRSGPDRRPGPPLPAHVLPVP